MLVPRLFLSARHPDRLAQSLEKLNQLLDDDNWVADLQKAEADPKNKCWTCDGTGGPTKDGKPCPMCNGKGHHV